MKDTSLCLKSQAGRRREDLGGSKKVEYVHNNNNKKKEEKCNKLNKIEANVDLFKHLRNLKEKCMDINVRCWKTKKNFYQKYFLKVLHNIILKSKWKDP